MSGMETSVLLAIGTRKGLWLAHSDDRESWKVDGPYLLATEVPSVAIDTREGSPRLLVGARSEHWGPTVQRSDDLGQTWSEHEGGAIVFPEGGAAVHTVVPHPTDDGKVAVAMSTGGVYSSLDGGDSWQPHNAGIRVSFMP